MLVEPELLGSGTRLATFALSGVALALAAVSAPWVGALISTMNSTKAAIRNRMPNQLTGSTPNP